MSQFMYLDNYAKSRRNFFKVFTASLISFNFYFIQKENTKSIIIKKIENNYWLLSSKDF